MHDDHRPAESGGLVKIPGVGRTAPLGSYFLAIINGRLIGTWLVGPFCLYPRENMESNHD
jgi:hypothetical protein